MKKLKPIIVSLYVFLLATISILAYNEAIQDIPAPPTKQEIISGGIIQKCSASEEFFADNEIAGLSLDMNERYVISRKLCSTSVEEVVKKVKPSLIVEPNRIYHGQSAVDVVRQREGELTPEMIHVILEEGYVLGEYHDVGETYASGVGQTGKFKGMTFKESFAAHEERAYKMFPNLDKYSSELRSNIISSVYRGGISGSPKTRALINQGRFSEAADEFLDNNEYRDSLVNNKGVAKRMERLATALKHEQSNLPKKE